MCLRTGMTAATAGDDCSAHIFSVSCPVILHDKHSCISYCQQHVVRQREVSLLLRERKYECGQQATLT